MMQKNEIVKVKIEDIGVGGEGIGKVEGYTLFIKDAIIGDVVEGKSRSVRWQENAAAVRSRR